MTEKTISGVSIIYTAPSGKFIKRFDFVEQNMHVYFSDDTSTIVTDDRQAQ